MHRSNRGTAKSYMSSVETNSETFNREYKEKMRAPVYVALCPAYLQHVGEEMGTFKHSIPHPKQIDR